MGRTLLDISDDLLALENLLMEQEGDITGAEEIVKGWFDELEGDLHGKLDGYAALITEMLGRAKIRREEAERLSNRARIDENSAKYLKVRLLEFFQTHGHKKIETARYRISVANNGGKQPMEIDLQPDDLPDEFQRIEVKADQEAIRSALEKIKLPFARMLPRGQHIRIK